MAPLWLHEILAWLLSCQIVKIIYFYYVRFRTVLFLTCNFYISRRKVSNIDVDNDSLSNIDQSINDDDATGDDQLESKASGTWFTLISVLNVLC